MLGVDSACLEAHSYTDTQISQKTTVTRGASGELLLVRNNLVFPTQSFFFFSCLCVQNNNHI